MPFADQLLGGQSHAALIGRQESETEFLTLVRQYLINRIKAEIEYAKNLNSLTDGVVHKTNGLQISSGLYKLWQTILEKTVEFASLVRKNNEILSNETLDSLNNLISDKKATKKHYIQEKQKLDSELSKLQEDAVKARENYGKLVEKARQEQEKHEILSRGLNRNGKNVTKIDDAWQKFCKTSTKLHNSHNHYIISMRESNSQNALMREQLLPALLNYEEKILIQQSQKSKSILEEAVDFFSHSGESFESIQSMLKSSLQQISSAEEYQEFVTQNQSKLQPEEDFIFDETLLSSYRGRLKADELSLDTFTTESLTLAQKKLETRQQELTERAEKLRREVTAVRGELQVMEEAGGDMDEAQQQRHAARLQLELTEVDCRLDRCQRMLGELADVFERCSGIPPALEGFNEAGAHMSSRSRSSSIDHLAAADAAAGLTGGAGFHRLQKLSRSLHRKLRRSHAGNSSGQASQRASYMGSMSSLSGRERRDRDRERDRSSVPPPVELPTPAPAVPDTEVDDVFAEQEEAAPRCANEYLDEPSSAVQGDIEKEPWFHGVLPRDEVQRLLQEDGDFLVRESHKSTRQENEARKMVLSVMWQGHKHFIIQGQPGAWRFEKNSYLTIAELIVEQQRSNEPVTAKSGAFLTNPVPRSDWQLNNDDIQLQREIGKGNFGTVFKGVYNGQEVAVKTCKEVLTDDLRAKFLQEGKTLLNYNHPNIVRLIGIAAQRQPVMIVMEYVPGGALLSYLKRHRDSLELGLMLCMCIDAGAGMAYLEGRNCIHRDLAARNCLVGYENVIKIGDFGMSREEEVYEVSGGLKQIPIKWTAIEALNTAKYTSKADVWSFGVLMWEIFSGGATPYPGLTNPQTRDKVEAGYRMPAPESTPTAIYDLMLRCWMAEPEMRPSFRALHELLTHIYSDLIKADPDQSMV